MTAPTGARETEHTVARLLDFERQYCIKHTGRKEDAIIAVLGLQPAHYYALLSRAIDTQAALEHDPELTHRLIRHRADTLRRRSPVLRSREDGTA